MAEYLFSYGTLQKEKTQFNLFGRLLKGFKDVLTGYKLSPIEITDEKFLAKGEGKNQLTVIATNNPADRIEGTALEVTKEELLFADKYEPANYKRMKVLLQSGTEAWIYAVI
jgi:Gamma-glutamyl cyclotransferase, AIG2-like